MNGETVRRKEGPLVIEATAHQFSDDLGPLASVRVVNEGGVVVGLIKGVSCDAMISVLLDVWEKADEVK